MKPCIQAPLALPACMCGNPDMRLTTGCLEKKIAMQM
jgi:hypothetical protein